MRLPLLCLALSLVAVSCQDVRIDSTGNAAQPNPIPDAAPTATPGIRSLTVGSGTVDVLIQLPEAGAEVALFRGDTPDTVYDDSPIFARIRSERVEVTNLTDGTPTYFGLGVRDRSGPYTPTGLIVQARPNPPIFVDANSDAATPDGKTPATAFKTLALGLDAAAKLGGGNVWVRDGRYEARHVVPVGVAVFGGFGIDFDRTTRRVGDSQTVLTAPAGETVVVAGAGADPVVLDGVTIDGADIAATGIDAGSSVLELRSVALRDMFGDGLSLHEDARTSVTLARLIRCTVESNGANGVRVGGAFDLRIDASTFDRNRDDGVRLDDLVAPEGLVARFAMTSSRVFGNDDRGLTADLAAPTGAAKPGRFDVVIRGSEFSCNRDEGVFLNPSYDTRSGWNANLVVRETTIRGNGGDGVRLDAFGPADTLFHRLLVTANSKNGVHVTSYRFDPGLIVLSGSVVSGNGDTGLLNAHPRKNVAVSHSIFTGNASGGFVSEHARGYVTSSIVYNQVLPWTGVSTAYSVAVRDPGHSGFVNVPTSYSRVIARFGQQVTIDGVPPTYGNLVELADDNVPRIVTELNGSSIVFEKPVSDCLRLPSVLPEFFGKTSVVEDYRLTLRSPALFAGMTAPGAEPLDAGVFAAPGSGRPGVADVVPHELFRLSQTDPKLDREVGPSEMITLDFSHDVDAKSLNALTVRAVTNVGRVIPMTRELDGSRMTLRPSPEGWGQYPFAIRLHVGLRSTAGNALATPLAIPVRPFIR